MLLKEALLAMTYSRRSLRSQLPSALEGLTAGFGMGPGVPSSLTSPTELLSTCQSVPGARPGTLTTERKSADELPDDQVLPSHVN